MSSSLAEDGMDRATVGTLEACLKASITRSALYRNMGKPGQGKKIEYAHTQTRRRRIYVDTLFRSPDGQPLDRETLAAALEHGTISLRKLCRELGICPRTAYNWIEAGRLRCIITASRQKRFILPRLWLPLPKTGGGH